MLFATRPLKYVLRQTAPHRKLRLKLEWSKGYTQPPHHSSGVEVWQRPDVNTSDSVGKGGDFRTVVNFRSQLQLSLSSTSFASTSTVSESSRVGILTMNLLKE